MEAPVPGCGSGVRWGRQNPHGFGLVNSARLAGRDVRTAAGRHIRFSPEIQPLAALAVLFYAVLP